MDGDGRRYKVMHLAGELLLCLHPPRFWDVIISIEPEGNTHSHGNIIL